MNVCPPIPDLLRALDRAPTVSAACVAMGVSEDQIARALKNANLMTAGLYVAGKNRFFVEHLGTLRKDIASIQAPKPPAAILAADRAAADAKRQRAEREGLVAELREERARNAFAGAIGVPLAPVVARRERASGLREGALVALASDWHVEERVDPKAVAGRNEYSLKIAEKRARKFFDGIEWLLRFERAAFKIRDVVLWLGGDFFSGFIHPELVETAALSPVESIIFVRRILSEGIRRLLLDGETHRIVVPCSYGNHGRTTEKRRIATGAQNSYEWLMYQTMKADFAGEKRVEFSCDASAHQYVEIYGETLHFTHGDELKYAGGVGGLAIPLGKRVPQWDRVRRARYHHIGHFHQFLDLGHSVVNGSLIGFNAYAQSIGASVEPPQQAAYVFDSKRGKALVTPIWVGE